MNVIIISLGEQMIKQIIDFLQNLTEKIMRLSFIPRTFYMVLLALLGNIIIYRIILYPKLIYLFFILISSEYMRVKSNEYLAKKIFKIEFKRDLSNILDPIALIILLAETFFNTRFIFITPILLTFWTRPLNVNYRFFTESKLKILFVSFSKTLVSLLIVVTSFIGIKYLNVSIAELALRSSSVSLIQNIVLFSFVINAGLIIINLIPMAPFEMGIALEHISSMEIRKFLIGTRPFGSLIALVLYFLNILPMFTYYGYNLLLNLLIKFI